MREQPTPLVLWDLGTAYDFFVSLDVLHKPTEYGLRGAWAAGVRARLAGPEREILEQSVALFDLPLHWVHNLADPKDGATVLWTLGQIPAAKRLAALTLSPKTPLEVQQILQEVAANHRWGEREEKTLQSAYAGRTAEECWHPPKGVSIILEWWARTEEFGQRYLQALQAYHESFFSDEEDRIRPALRKALEQAQTLSRELSLGDLVEKLSQGLRFIELPAVDELVMAPSYWCTPFMFFGKSSPQREIWVFGARPADASLVPGEVIPDALLQTLKALSDPTRLRILRYLAKAPLSPAQLARRLRLRAPTVTHHLKALRRAGLVQLSLGESSDEECPKEAYATRFEALASAYVSLEDFLGKSEPTE